MSKRKRIELTKLTQLTSEEVTLMYMDNYIESLNGNRLYTNQDLINFTNQLNTKEKEKFTKISARCGILDQFTFFINKMESDFWEADRILLIINCKLNKLSLDLKNLKLAIKRDSTIMSIKEIINSSYTDYTNNLKDLANSFLTAKRYLEKGIVYFGILEIFAEKYKDTKLEEYLENAIDKAIHNTLINHMIIDNICNNIEKLDNSSLPSGSVCQIKRQIDGNPFEVVSDPNVIKIRNYIYNTPLTEFSFIKLLTLSNPKQEITRDTSLEIYDS